MKTQGEIFIQENRKVAWFSFAQYFIDKFIQNLTTQDKHPLNSAIFTKKLHMVICAVCNGLITVHWKTDALHSDVIVT